MLSTFRQREQEMKVKRIHLFDVLLSNIEFILHVKKDFFTSVKHAYK